MQRQPSPLLLPIGHSARVAKSTAVGADWALVGGYGGLWLTPAGLQLNHLPKKNHYNRFGTIAGAIEAGFILRVLRYRDFLELRVTPNNCTPLSYSCGTPNNGLLYNTLPT